MPDDDPRRLPGATDPAGRDELASTLRRHVATLVAAPRNRKADTGHLKAVRDYAGEQLRAAGWVTTQDFTTSAALGVSDAGYPTANLWPLRVRGAVAGVNIIATRSGGPITQDTLLVLAHLDSVRNSPGANDNASGAAAVLADAPDIPSPSGRRDVALGLVDLEEIIMAGSSQLARAVTRLAATVLRTRTNTRPARARRARSCRTTWSGTSWSRWSPVSL